MTPVQYLTHIRFGIYAVIVAIALLITVILGVKFRKKAHHWAYMHQTLRGYFPPYKIAVIFSGMILVGLMTPIIGGVIGNKVADGLSEDARYTELVQERRKEIKSELKGSKIDSEGSSSTVKVFTLNNRNSSPRRLVSVQEYPLNQLRTKVPYNKTSDQGLLHQYSIGNRLFYLSSLSNLPLELGSLNINQLQYAVNIKDLSKYRVIKFKVYNQVDKKTYDYIVPLKLVGTKRSGVKTSIVLTRVNGTLVDGTLCYGG